MINSFLEPDPRLIDVTLPPSGYPEEWMKKDRVAGALFAAAGDASREFPSDLWIDEKDWAAKAEENDANETWAINYLDRFTNQNPTHECTCHSLRANAEAARNRQRAVRFGKGPQKNYRYDDSKWSGSVWLSPLSVYAKANPRQWGGAGVQQVLNIAVDRGMLPELIQPFDYKFVHAIQGTTGAGGLNQSRGLWLPESKFPPGWRESAKWFRPTEVIFPRTWQQAVCLVLHGIAVSVGRNGHAVPWVFFNAKTKTMGYTDSYDIIRYDSYNTVRSCGGSGSFGISQMIVPNDWMKPVG